MRVPRIYSPGVLSAGLSVELDKNASHHVLRVLRLRTGARIRLFNGQNQEFLAELQNADKAVAAVLLLEPLIGDMESPLGIHLGQGISRGEKMDYTLQKAVELGVDSITPVFTEFTEIKLSSERLEKRMLHWRAIIISACEQCGRSYLPRLEEPQRLSSWLSGREEDLRLLLHPYDGDSLSNFACSEKRLALLAGPEGGFSEAEVLLAKENGFQVWRFGPRILRTETAALAAIAALQSRWGDCG